MKRIIKILHIFPPINILCLSQQITCFSKAFSISFTNKCDIYYCFKKSFYCKYTTCSHKIMDLHSVVKSIEQIFPLSAAEKWDNTGLLIKPKNNLKVSSIFFTIDLTEKVLEEALSLKTDMILAYHPPIFTPLTKLSCDNWKDRIIMTCIEKSIAVYSPHTSCDTVVGGVNDWLIKCLEVCEIKAIESKKDSTDMIGILEFNLSTKVNAENMFSNIPGFKIVSVNKYGSEQYIRMLTSYRESDALTTLSAYSEITHVSFKSALRNDIIKGTGRIARLKEPRKLSDCISSIKKYLKMAQVNVALAVKHSMDTEIRTIAVCAGSGASVLKDVDADLYLTGEMSHHEVLHATHGNASVILVGHTNSERGYLETMTDLLQPQLRNVKLHISKSDGHPLSII